jgi:hypothetical protein
VSQSDHLDRFDDRELIADRHGGVINARPRSYQSAIRQWRSAPRI